MASSDDDVIDPYARGSAADPGPFVIEDVYNKDFRLELTNFDLPHGRARKEAAFELGGPVEHDKVWLDGRSDPVIHVHQARNRPLTIKGHFRDHLWGANGHARQMVQELEAFRFRCRELILTWSNYRWRAFMEEAKYPLEDAHSITYEITFTIISGPFQATSPDELLEPDFRESPQDDTALALARLEELKERSNLEYLAATISLALSNATTALDSALTGALIEAQRFTELGASVTTQPRNLIGKCQEAQARIAELHDTLTLVDPTDPASLPLTDDLVLDVVTASTLASWWSFRDDAVFACTEMADVMRQVQATARRRLQKTKRLYLVRTGDTLESIAYARLGSPGRASDLGILPQDLIPGRFIRIPEAA